MLNVKKKNLLATVHTCACAHTHTHTSYSSVNFSSKGEKLSWRANFPNRLVCATPQKQGWESFISWRLFHGIHLLLERQLGTPWTDNGPHFISEKWVWFLKLKAERDIRLAFTPATDWQGNFHHTYSSHFPLFLHSPLFSLFCLFVLHQVSFRCRHTSWMWPASKVLNNNVLSMLITFDRK